MVSSSTGLVSLSNTLRPIHVVNKGEISLFFMTNIYCIHIEYCIYIFIYIIVVQLPSHVQLCNPLDCSMPGLLDPHHFPKFAQVHVRCISDTITYIYIYISHLLYPFI